MATAQAERSEGPLTAKNEVALYRFSANSKQLKGIFQAFRNFGPTFVRLRKGLMIRGLVSFGACVVLAILFGTFKGPGYFWSVPTLCFTAAWFSLVYWLLSGVSRTPMGSLRLFFAISVGLFLVPFMVWLPAERWGLFLRAEKPGALWIALMLVAPTLFVYGINRLIVWITISNSSVREDELSYLEQILMPLASDLTPKQTLELGINPFDAQWSQARVADARARPGYYYPTYLDVVLDLGFEPAPGCFFSLKIANLRIDKYKRRKNKYKGTMHRVLFSCKLKAPGVGKLFSDPKSLEKLKELGSVSFEDDFVAVKKTEKLQIQGDRTSTPLLQKPEQILATVHGIFEVAFDSFKAAKKATAP